MTTSSRTRTCIRNILALGVVASVTAACAVDHATSTEPITTTFAPTSPPSTLVVRWSIGGTTDPNACFATGSDSIVITITDPNGLDVGTFAQACIPFSTSITLGAGSYQGFAALLDQNGQPRTTTVGISPFTLLGNDTFVVTVAFPTSSFF
jgi:hypothetical protein